MIPLNDLIARKQTLGLSNSGIARLSGVSKPTVDRIMSGRHDRATLANVAKIAGTLGMEIRFAAREDAETGLERLRKHDRRRRPGLYRY